MQEIVVTDTWRDRIEDLIGRARENRLLLAVAASVIAVSLLFWSRGPSARVAPPARALSHPLASPSIPAGVIVHIAGAVRRPGLYEFPNGARIADAIATAGGALHPADLDALNLAELLVDGVQLHVPRRGDTAETAAGAAASSTGSPSVEVVPLNTADAAALDTIPGIGPVTAAAILDHRAEIGSFASVDELIDVVGIGPATLENVRPYVTL